jgi:hypothetical protein
MILASGMVVLLSCDPIGSALAFVDPATPALEESIASIKQVALKLNISERA